MQRSTVQYHLDRLWQRGCLFLGTEQAIMGGAMTWISERYLVAAISDNGGFGVIACGAMSPDRLADEIQGVRQLTAKPFGVNVIIIHPQLDSLLEICADLKVSHVVLAGGLPSSASIKRIKHFDAKVLCFAPSLGIAKKLIRSGSDALILEGMEAGGHIGPVSTSILAQEILPHIHDVPIFVAGGIGRGEALLSFLEMGASGVQIGTRFVCALECIAHPHFKQAFIRASARDAVPSVQLDERFPVIPVRALVNHATRRFLEHQRTVITHFHDGTLSLKQAQLDIEHFWAGALKYAAIDGDIENGSLMAGQSVGMISREQSVGDILDEIVTQAHQALEIRLPLS